MYTSKEMIDFVKDYFDEDNILSDTDIFDIGYYGDDFDDFFLKYTDKYKVNMDDFLWYFHTSEENSGFGLGALFFKAPNQRVAHIAVTPKMLADFANSGKWEIHYPPHKLPKYRGDMVINAIVGLGMFFVLLFFIFKKCSSVFST